MTSEIPSTLELEKWYNEAYNIPSFIETLSAYKKDALINYCKSLIKSAIKRSVPIFRIYPEKKYPKDIPQDKHWNYFMNTIFYDNLYKPVYVLNILGISWTPEESYKKIVASEEIKKGRPKKETKPEIYNEKEKRKFCQFEIAFYLIFKGQNICDPKYDDNDILKEIAKKFGHESSSSAQRIYDKYLNKIKIAKREKIELKNILEVVSEKTSVSFKRIEFYISEILVLLEPDEKKKAEKYLNKLEIINN